ADNIWLDGPRNAFADLSDAWNPDEMDALLLVVPHSRAANFSGQGDFHMDAVGRLTRRHPGRIAPFIYTGIQIVSHRLLRDAPEGPFGTMQLWERAIEEGRLFGTSFTGRWFEVGTPQAIGPTEDELRRG
ncbi:MAG: nucleotidyltransferase family protein, partial [Tsuneonella sp.]